MAAMLTMPLGTPAEVTAEAIAKLEASALALRQEIDAETETRWDRWRVLGWPKNHRNGMPFSKSQEVVWKKQPRK